MAGDERLVIEVYVGDDERHLFEAVMQTDNARRQVVRLIVVPDLERCPHASGCVMLEWDADHGLEMALMTLTETGTPATRVMLVGALLVAREIVRTRYTHVKTLVLRDDAMITSPEHGPFHETLIDVLLGRDPHLSRHLGARPCSDATAQRLAAAQRKVAMPVFQGRRKMNGTCQDWLENIAMLRYRDETWRSTHAELVRRVRAADRGGDGGQFAAVVLEIAGNAWLKAHDAQIRATHDDAASRGQSWAQFLTTLLREHGLAFLAACEAALVSQFDVRDLVGARWAVPLDDLPTRCDGRAIRAAIVGASSAPEAWVLRAAIAAQSAQLRAIALEHPYDGAARRVHRV